MKTATLPYNMQFFAAEGGNQADGADNQGQSTQAEQQQSQSSNTPTGQAVDYNKIQQMLDGTLRAKEDVALKAYFKQQGLSQEEAEQAISAFKQQKASQQPDIEALTQQAQIAQEAAQKAQVESAATIAAVSLGLDMKTISYAIKMADLSQAVGQDGKVNEESVTNALKKVLEDVPALKPQSGQATGFIQVGATGTGTQQTATDDALKAAFGL